MVNAKKRDARLATQHPDSKGVNARRDGTRPKGAGALTSTKGGGSGDFRRKQTSGE